MSASQKEQGSLLKEECRSSFPELLPSGLTELWSPEEEEQGAHHMEADGSSFVPPWLPGAQILLKILPGIITLLLFFWSI